MIRPPGIDHGAFVVSPATVWLLWHAATMHWYYFYSQPLNRYWIQVRMRPCLDVETFDDPENGNYLRYIYYIIIVIMVINAITGIIQINCVLRDD